MREKEAGNFFQTPTAAKVAAARRATEAKLELRSMVSMY